MRRSARPDGWMDAWTEVDPAAGFRYEAAGEGGSAYIRRHVFRAALDAERRMWGEGDPQRAALTLDNYTIEDRGSNAEGLSSLAVKPRRHDVLLIDGSVFVTPEDGDMVRIEGRLSKTPSFWTRRVDVVRTYDRIVGVRVPVAIESVAQVVIAGRSTFKMTPTTKPSTASAWATRRRGHRHRLPTGDNVDDRRHSERPSAVGRRRACGLGDPRRCPRGRYGAAARVDCVSRQALRVRALAQRRRNGRRPASRHR